jgi:hypothetical protein
MPYVLFILNDIRNCSIRNRYMFVNVCFWHLTFFTVRAINSARYNTFYTRDLKKHNVKLPPVGYRLWR